MPPFMFCLSCKEEDSVNLVNPGQLAFDIDGVIADAISLFIDMAKDEYGIDTVSYDDILSYSVESLDGIDPEIVHTIFTRIVDGDFSHSLKPIPGAPEILADIHDKTGRLLLVTARPKEAAIREWMEKEIPVPIHDIEIVPTGSFEGKVDVLKTYGISHFVEDRLETCYILDDAGIKPILFVQPWNRKTHPFQEANGWDALKKMIQWT